MGHFINTGLTPDSPKSLSPTPRLSILLTLLLAFIATLTIFKTFRPSFFQTKRHQFTTRQSLWKRNAHRYNTTVKCVRPLDMENAMEGLGAILRRNQLAVFLADVYDAKLAWDYMRSSHMYETHTFFSECPKVTENCKLRQREMILPRCVRGDCECLWKGAEKYVSSSESHCSVLGLKNDRLVTQEYSGCMYDVMNRYFVHSNKTTELEYDAIHVRMGDLKNMRGEKVPSEIELYYLLEAMCKISDRPIYILTEGYPLIPAVSCFDRLFMASDTSIYDAFSIMHHAKTISVGSSSFSIAMAEVAKPEEVVTLYRTLDLYEWLESDRWTVVMDKGEFFHFNSKEMMIHTLLSGKDPRARTYRREGWYNATSFSMKKISKTKYYNESSFWVSI